MRPESRTLVDGICLSLLPLFSMTLILLTSKPAVKHVLKKSAQKMRRAIFSDWLTHLYLALSLGRNLLQGRSSVALEGFSFLFFST